MYKHGQKAKMYNKMKRHVCIIIRITIILQTVKLFVKLLAQTAEYERIIVVKYEFDQSTIYTGICNIKKQKPETRTYLFI